MLVQLDDGLDGHPALVGQHHAGHRGRVEAGIGAQLVGDGVGDDGGDQRERPPQVVRDPVAVEDDHQPGGHHGPHRAADDGDAPDGHHRLADGALVEQEDLEHAHPEHRADRVDDDALPPEDAAHTGRSRAWRRRGITTVGPVTTMIEPNSTATPRGRSVRTTAATEAMTRVTSTPMVRRRTTTRRVVEPISAQAG